MKKLIIKGIIINADEIQTIEGYNQQGTQTEKEKFFVFVKFKTKSVNAQGYLNNDSRFIPFETKEERDLALKNI